jgi:hypothetical protein
MDLFSHGIRPITSKNTPAERVGLAEMHVMD